MPSQQTDDLVFNAGEAVSDYHFVAWTRGLQIVALHRGLRSTLWRFQPSRRTFYQGA